MLLFKVSKVEMKREGICGVAVDLNMGEWSVKKYV